MRTRTHLKAQWQSPTQEVPDGIERRAAGRGEPVQGQGLPEYAIILSLVAVVVVGIMVLLGSGVKQALCKPLIGLNPEYATECLAEPEGQASPDDTSYPISALAAYSSSRGHLVIAARLPAGATGNLTVEGYGAMDYLPQKDVYVLVINTDTPPSSVTVNSSDGGTITVDVRTH